MRQAVTMEPPAAAGKGQLLSLHPMLPAAHSILFPRTSAGTFLDISVGCCNAFNQSETRRSGRGRESKCFPASLAKEPVPGLNSVPEHSRGWGKEEARASLRAAETCSISWSVRPKGPSASHRSQQVTLKHNIGRLEGKAKRGHVDRNWNTWEFVPLHSETLREDNTLPKKWCQSQEVLQIFPQKRCTKRRSRCCDAYTLEYVKDLLYQQK